MRPMLKHCSTRSSPHSYAAQISLGSNVSALLHIKLAPAPTKLPKAPKV